MDVNQRNAHPRDEDVSFEENTHTYSIKGSSEGVTSVTTLLDDFFPKFDPDTIIDKYYSRWQQNPLKKPECYGKTREEIKEMWERDGEEAENVKGGESMKAEWVLKEVESGRSMRWNGGSPMV